MRKFVLFIVIAGLLLAGCVNPPQQSNTTYTPPVLTNSTPAPSPATPPPNSTAAPVNYTLPPGYSINLGDNATIDYIMMVDGKVIDTSNATLANLSGIYDPQRQYGPITVEVQLNKSLITGFVIGLLGMHVNETGVFSVDPARGYGPWDPNKVIMIPRYYNKSLMETIPRSYLDQAGVANYTNGTAFNTAYGTVFIQNMTDTNVTIFYFSLTQGYNFTVNGVPQTVVGYHTSNPSDPVATIQFDLDENYSYVLPDPNTGQTTQYLITKVTDQNITLDGNNPLANKTLNFRVTVEGIVPGQPPG